MNHNPKTKVLFTQLTIMALTAAIYFQSESGLPGAAAAFIVMQVGSFLGILWGERLRRRMRERMEALPLSRR
jgi:hypothetical protein